MVVAQSLLASAHDPRTARSPSVVVDLQPVFGVGTETIKPASPTALDNFGQFSASIVSLQAGSSFSFLAF